jgi:hypothetical protein
MTHTRHDKPKTSEADSRSDPSRQPVAEDARPERLDNAKVSEADPASLPSNTEKDPDEWTTGGETMTGAQASYLKTLCEEAGEPFDARLTKAEASKRIDALQARTGRGRTH